ncbi:hypothetical protein CFP56_015538 [Quercus suber]|uniref:ARM repeat superfamily protein n=1 Tax=Quercus suber TaxID=58331 RepID=A0AAW0KRG4_QUESU
MQAKALTTDVEGAKVLRKEARNALLELAKDEYYRILVIDEGLIPVPMIGASAYKSFKPGLYSWPSLPDGTEIKQTSKGPSKYGASEVLLGLNIDDKNVNIEETKMKAIVARSQQQFLARIGAIEIENGEKSQSGCFSEQRLTLLPWVDGVARLVLILELEDESAISRAAESIADASINEHIRVAFKEAGAIKHLVRLLGHNNDSVRLSATQALERLSSSNHVCQIIEAEGIIDPLVNTLKHSQTSESLIEKSLNLLARILDPSKEMKSKFYDGPVNGSKKLSEATKNPEDSAVLTGNMADKPISNVNAREDVLDNAFIARLVDILKSSSPNLQRKASSVLEFVTINDPSMDSIISEPRPNLEDVLDNAFIARLVDILKSSSPNLQRKASSVLEFVTINDPSMDSIISVDIESGLAAVFQQKVLNDVDSDVEGQQPEKYALEVEEAGLAISAASRLLTKLLDSPQFCQSINSTYFTKLLREILKSNVPLHYKDWVAASLVKLSSLSDCKLDSGNPINMEVTLYETIPRLIEKMKTSFSPEAEEAAVMELNRIIAEGMVDSTQAIASEGGIFPLVNLIEDGSERAVEASLGILYNLSMDSENHSAIVAAGAVPALRRIVQLQRPQWPRALHTIILFKLETASDVDSDVEGQQPEKYALEVEEAGLAISAASRLLTKLLDSPQFCQSINSTYFTKLLREILKSNVPLHYKDWVAASLVKLSSLSDCKLDSGNPINMEVTLYETIPRLIEKMKTSFSPEAEEAAVMELNRIIAEGMVDSTQAIASEGGIFPLVNLIEDGSERAVEASLGILYNLSMDSENHSAIVAAGAVPALRRIVQLQRPQWPRALHVLRTLPT